MKNVGYILYKTGQNAISVIVVCEEMLFTL